MIEPSAEQSAIEKARKALTGYSPEDQAVLELVNFLIKRYGISVYELDVYSTHECERPL